VASRFGQGTIAFAGIEFRVQVHETLAVASSILVQVVLLVFVAVLNRALLPYALIGAIVYSVFQLGQRIQNEAAYIRIDHKLHELYHASPVTPEGYFLGMSVGVLLAYLPPTVFLAILLAVIHPLAPIAIGVFLLGLAGLWLLSSSLGYAFSTLFRDQKAIWPYASLLTNAFGVFPAVLYPVTLLPAAWQTVMLFIPTSAVAILTESVQGGLLSLSNGSLLLAALSLSVETAVGFAIAVSWARRSAREH
jgi:ABC-2 type transport system permease protein